VNTKTITLLLCLSLDVFGDSKKVVKFSPIEIAKSEQEKKTFRFSPSVDIYSDSKKEGNYPLAYEVLLYSEDKLATAEYPFGTVLNSFGKPLRQKDGSLRVSTSQDSNSIIYDGKETYLFTHFEESAGAIVQSKLALQKDKLEVLSLKPMNFSSIDGINNVCAGSTTPWNSHLGGEESNAESIYDDVKSPLFVDCSDPLQQSRSYCKTKFKIQSYLGQKKFNIYNYGYIVEATVNNSKNKIAKHYTTGKYAPEMAVVMGDYKTIYISDDGDSSAFFKLVLDKEVHAFDNNWKGTLYAAQFQSTNATQSYNLKWIKLGHASDKELKKIIDLRPKVSDFFEISLVPRDGYTKIKADEIYYIKVKEYVKSRLFPTKEEFMKGLAFLESRKYAAIVGASTHFKKEEGLAYDKERKTLFLALSKIPNNVCGAVYRLELDKEYSAVTMEAIAMGKELKEGDSDYLKYKNEYFCHPDFVANPDNIAYIGSNILLIGEDTGLHFNNMIFAYDTQEKSLTRVATLPTGAEATGIARGFVDGKNILFINAQHPFDDVCSAADKSSDCNSEILKNVKHEDLRGFVGYVNGLPKDFF
jgi:uncharacterized protein